MGVPGQKTMGGKATALLKHNWAILLAAPPPHRLVSPGLPAGSHAEQPPGGLATSWFSRAWPFPQLLPLEL